MKKLLFTPPDPFSLSPLLAILPNCGDVTMLEPLTTALFARYEKVAALQREIASELGEPAAPILRKANAEAVMLKQVLDWLSTQSTGTGQ